MVTKSQSLFVSLCKLCLKRKDGKEVAELANEKRPCLPIERHEITLQSLVSQMFLSESEASVIVKEYLQDESSVVRQAFAVYDVRDNFDEFAFVIKKMATLYSMK